MTIHVTSLDFDGCLFHNRYYKIFENDVILANLRFLNTLRQENRRFSQTFIYIGSNRQSRALDMNNIINSGSESCFHAIQKIAKYIKSTFVPLLTADILNDEADYLAYSRIMDKHYRGEHGASFFDESKLVILYAQMHHMASRHSSEGIIFDFYDDRGMGFMMPDDILEHLSTFFSTYPEMIPHNVTLRLNHYIGKNVTNLLEKKGTGAIDTEYRQTVIDMMGASITHEPDVFSKYCVDYVTPTLLANFKACRADYMAQMPMVIKPGATLKTAKLKEHIKQRQEIYRRYEQDRVDGFSYFGASIVPHRLSEIKTERPSFREKARNAETCLEQATEQLSACFGSSLRGLLAFGTFFNVKPEVQSMPIKNKSQRSNNTHLKVK